MGPVFFLSFFLMLVAFAFGGASRLHALPLAIVEVASLPVLILSAQRLLHRGAWAQSRVPLLLLAAICVFPFLQLIPLPYDVWTSLPGREPLVAAATYAGLGEVAQPLSVYPKSTWHSALALLPPVAMFLAVLQLSSRERRLLTAVALVAIVVNLAFGAGQIVGRDSPLYLYEPTNYGMAVGMFSNRNHYSVLLVTALPMAALWLMSLGSRGKELRIFVAVAGLTVLALIVVGVIMARSRAGVGLLAPSFMIAAAMLWKSERSGPSRTILYGLLAAVVLASAAGIAFGGRELTQRLGTDLSTDARFAAAPEIWRQSLAHLPFGTGIGSFEPVFQSFEPLSLIGGEFLNHAHNDYLELLLEGGVAAVVLFAAFIIWWGVAIIGALRAQGLHAELARVGAAITGLLLLHSAVDYPLRTPALATFFAFGLALMVKTETSGRRGAVKIRFRRAAA